MAYNDGNYINFGFLITPVVKKLLMINLIAFVLQLGLKIIGLDYWLMLAPYYTIRGCFWQPLTYMFLHADLSHLFFNMLGLFIFGPSLEEHRGSSWFLRYYLISGVGAGLIIFLYHFGSQRPTLGASGAIFAILGAFAYYWPMRPIYLWGILPVPAIILVGIYAIIEISSINSLSGVSHIGHAGGLVIGLAYLFITENTNLENRFSRAWFQWKKKQNRPKIRIVPSPPKPSPKHSDPQEDRRRMDKILEKVATHGMNSLTDKEREFLDSIRHQL
ncbi:MAG: hypothetical protein B6244_03785 [Candidatus Cloacimonetes bacterium 4572_55]|nr:MAG: hypothetical protein B6244_03785 [Candidatus Cloacimonetes bacterium 4572_55]